MRRLLNAGRIWVVSAGIFALMLVPANRARADDDLAKRFMTEAPKKKAEYQRLSTRLQVEWKVRKRLTGTADWPEPVERYQMKRDHPGERGLLIAHLGDSRSQGFVFNPNYGFSISRNGANAPWKLRQVSTENPKYDVALNPDKEEMTYGGPFNFYQYFLWALIDEPGFKIRNASAVTHEGKERIRIEFACTRIDDHPMGLGSTHHYEKGWFIVDPSSYWRLCEWEANVKLANTTQKIVTTMHGVVECTTTKAGLPVEKHSLVRVKGRNTAGKDINFDAEWKNEYTIEERDPDPAEFRLPAFGFPDHVKGSRIPPILLAFIIVTGAGIAFIVTGFLVLRRREMRLA